MQYSSHFAFPTGKVKSEMQLQLSIQPWICASGTYYCWVARGNVDSMLAQGFYIWPVLWESNPRFLDLGSNALTIRLHAPQVILLISPQPLLISQQSISLVHLVMAVVLK